MALPEPACNALKAVVIHPATEKHIQKYTDQKSYIVMETGEDYKNITKPFLAKQQFSIQVCVCQFCLKKGIENVQCPFNYLLCP